MSKGKKHPETDYEVGYGKPPKHTQFQPGQSGNPRGRRKKRPRPFLGIDEAMKRALDELITVNQGDRLSKITRREAFIAKIISDAFSCKPAALRFMSEDFGRERDMPTDAKVSPEFKEFVEALFTRAEDATTVKALYDRAREQYPDLPEFEFTDPRDLADVGPSKPM